MRGSAVRAVAIAAVVAVLGLLAGCDGGGSDVTLTQMKERATQVGEDLMAQAAGVTQEDLVIAPSSGIASDEDEAPSLDSGPRYWQWSNAIPLVDTADSKSVAQELAAHLAADGWTIGTSSPATPNTIEVRRKDDLGPDWLVELTWSLDSEDGKSVFVDVISPVTSKD